jgi:hypothetical protein
MTTKYTRAIACTQLNLIGCKLDGTKTQCCSWEGCATYNNYRLIDTELLVCGPHGYEINNKIRALFNNRFGVAIRSGTFDDTMVSMSEIVAYNKARLATPHKLVRANAVVMGRIGEGAGAAGPGRIEEVDIEGRAPGSMYVRPPVSMRAEESDEESDDDEPELTSVRGHVFSATRRPPVGKRRGNIRFADETDERIKQSLEDLMHAEVGRIGMSAFGDSIIARIMRKFELKRKW